LSARPSIPRRKSTDSAHTHTTAATGSWRVTMKRQRATRQLAHQPRLPGHGRRIRKALRQAIRARGHAAAPPPPHPGKPCTRRKSQSIHPPLHLKPWQSESALQRRRSRCAGSDGYNC
jgi:hypothetical protein